MEILNGLVWKGLLQSFENKDGDPMWGLPPEPHEHEWINPDIPTNRHELRRALQAGDVLEVKWRCAWPGCKVKKVTMAELTEL
jgi:hypothetical protein